MYEEDPGDEVEANPVGGSVPVIFSSLVVMHFLKVDSRLRRKEIQYGGQV